jgi:pilus assembly protein CpaF
MLGLGPLEPLLQDNEISDILVNGSADVWIEREGKLYRTEVKFLDDQHLMSVINRIVSRVGRRIDESSPMVDARLPDGSRVNAVIPPLAIDGPGLSIRRFGGHSIQMNDLVRSNALTFEMSEFLRMAVMTRLNIVVSGGTGSGKTTLLNCISSYIPENQRIITIEDAPNWHCNSRTCFDLRPGRKMWRARAKSASATFFATPCGCAPTA